MPKKVAVSACLLGHKCRYDGGHRKESSLDLEGCEVIPFCPEEKVLGTPRQTCDLYEGRMIGNESGEDVSEAIEAQAIALAQSHPDIKEVYLKSKSPSCALASAREYDKDGKLVRSDATGIFAKKLKELLPEATFYEKEGK